MSEHERIKYPADWPQDQKDALDKLFIEARAKKLWFYCPFGGGSPLWCTPDELQEAQGKGKFIWGHVNWELRDPRELVAAINLKMTQLQQELTRIERKITKDQQAD